MPSAKTKSPSMSSSSSSLSLSDRSMACAAFTASLSVVPLVPLTVVSVRIMRRPSAVRSCCSSAAIIVSPTRVVGGGTPALGSGRIVLGRTGETGSALTRAPPFSPSAAAAAVAAASRALRISRRRRLTSLALALTASLALALPPLRSRSRYTDVGADSDSAETASMSITPVRVPSSLSEYTSTFVESGWYRGGGGGATTRRDAAVSTRVSSMWTHSSSGIRRMDQQRWY